MANVAQTICTVVHSLQRGINLLQETPKLRRFSKTICGDLEFMSSVD
jgi:hypothetical protein